MLRFFQRLLLPAFLLLLTAPSACSSTSSGSASTQCKTDTDCTSGLSCIPFATFQDGGCDNSVRACSKACKTDGDCASLGAGYKCFASCPGSPKFCGATP